MKKLWQKKSKLNSQVEEYCSKENIQYDNKLVVYDCYGSIAHASMLHKIGILTLDELVDLKKGLTEIIKQAQTNKFHVVFGDEDVHTKIEGELTKRLGKVGEKLHTGRSRNDQVLTDMRLYSKDEIIHLALAVAHLAKSYFTLAKKHEYVIMPGYTHAQIAMPSSVDMWMGSFGESLLDDLLSLAHAYALNDQSPLGSGAAYGISLPLDRELVSELLGFSKVQNNSLYTQSSRVKTQLAVVAACHQIMLTLSRFAQDVLTFTMSEFGFFSLPDELCTGSSIMPQKKNVDIMEIVRARTHRVGSVYQALASIGTSLMSGYNSDFQETKAPFMDAITMTKSSIAITELVVEHMTINLDKLAKACTPELTATHAAYELVKKGIPFRTAYQQVGASLALLPAYDFPHILKASNHTGGPGNLKLATQLKLAKTQYSRWTLIQKQFHKTLSKLAQHP